MRTLLDPQFAYTPSNKTDVQATWARHGWVVPSKQKGDNSKLLDGLVQLVMVEFERAHRNDKYIDPAPAALLAKKNLH